HALALALKIGEPQAFRCELIDARRRRAAQDAASVTAELAPAEVVGEYQHDVGPLRGLRFSHALNCPNVVSSRKYSNGMADGGFRSDVARCALPRGRR